MEQANGEMERETPPMEKWREKPPSSPAVPYFKISNSMSLLRNNLNGLFGIPTIKCLRNKQVYFLTLLIVVLYRLYFAAGLSLNRLCSPYFHFCILRKFSSTGKK